MNKTTSSTRSKTQRVRTRYERTEYGRLVVVPGDPTRTSNVASWTVWHLPELTGVLLPAGIGAAVAPWMSGTGWLVPGAAWLVSGVVTVRWRLRAVRQAREQAAVRAGRDLPVVVTESPAGSDVDSTASAVDTSAAEATAPESGGGVRL